MPPADVKVNPDYASSGSTGPVGYATAITPANTDLVRGVTRAIYVGGVGNLVLKMAGEGDVVTFTNVQPGVLYPLRCSQIQTGSTATGIVACF